MNEFKPENQNRFDVTATAETHFSWLRTRLSTERTLMSWVRTATSLIGFGFTIVQFFEHLNQTAGVLPANNPQAPRYLGLSLIGSGTIALIVAAWEYLQLIKYLWSPDYQAIAGVDTIKHRTPIFAVTLVLIGIGVFTFGAVWFRVL